MDIHDIDDVVMNCEPTTYDTKKDIFSCRYCKRMYQSTIWLEQHEAECDLRPDSKFNKIMVKQTANPTENRAEDPDNASPSPEHGSSPSPEHESNPSPENEANIEPPSPIFYMPAGPSHNHIDAYDTLYHTNHRSNADHCNNEHEIYPHEDYENNPSTVTTSERNPNNDTNEIILEPMDSQPAETTEMPTPSPIKSPPPSSDNHLTSTPYQNIVKSDERGQEEDQDVNVPKLEPIRGATNELRDDEDSIVIYQDHQDSQESIYSDNEEEMPLREVAVNEEQNCTNEEMTPSNISADEEEETDSEDDSEYETFSG